MKKYVLWDWNGTLLDDTEAAIETLNDMIAKHGGKKITRSFYRENFSFPVKPFYEKIGVVLEGEDWDSLAREYHDIYASKEKQPAADAIAAVEKAKEKFAGQSILSALRQDLLERDSSIFGLKDKMDFVFGVDNLDGSSKAERAAEALRTVKEKFGDCEFFLVGDSLHDAEVAKANGIECVLYSGGTHTGERLSKAGRVVDSLSDAVSLIEEWQ